MKGIILLLLLVLSCKESNSIKNNVIYEYFPESKRNVSYEYIIENGDTILNGKSISTNQEGKVVAVGNYNNGKLEGTFVSYYDNGKVKSKKYIKEGKETAQSIFYNIKGKIEKYVLYNRKNEVAFIVDYDKKGDYLNHQGYIFADWFYSNENPSNIIVGDTVKYGFIIPSIPNVKKIFTVELLDYVDNDKIVREIKDLEPVGLIIKEKAIKDGKNTYKAKLKLEFNDLKRTIIVDSLELTFEIKKNKSKG